MERLAMKLFAIVQSEQGGVLLEYVLVTTAIILPLVGIVDGVFDPEGQVFNSAGAVTGGDFGLLGNAFVAMYQRVVHGLGLPYP